MLVETFLKLDQIDFHINGCETVRFDRLTDRGRRIAFLVKKDLIFYSITLDFNPRAIETGVISLSISNECTTLISYYQSLAKNNIAPDE